MNVTLTGREADFEGWHFSLHGQTVSVSGSTIEAGTGDCSGLATEIVRALGGAFPKTTPQERRITADQTNRSVVVGDTWIVKFISTFGGADRSALIEKRLQEAGDAIVPPLLGSVLWSHPERGISTIALASEYVPGAEDGWTWAPDDVIASVPRRDPDWPALLGSITAHMHLTLASAEFPPDTSANPCDPPEEANQIWREVDEQFRSRTESIGARMRNRLPAMREEMSNDPKEPSAPRMVIHGDLHVGQVLRDALGHYYLVDFDGDPQAAGAHPWRRYTAARDVAHMLVSIDLVAAVAQKRLGRVDDAFFDWADRAKDAYLEEYCGVLKSVGRESLCDVSELPGLAAEQLLRELRYAAGFLPEWEYAPDAVISRRYVSTSNESEVPWTPPALPMTSKGFRKRSASSPTG